MHQNATKIVSFGRYVSGSDLLVCGNHVFNHYRDGKNLGSYLCGDSIVDVVALCPNNVGICIECMYSQVHKYLFKQK